MCVLKRYSPTGDGGCEPTALDHECLEAMGDLMALADATGKTIHAVVKPSSAHDVVAMAFTSDNAISLSLTWQEGVCFDAD